MLSENTLNLLSVISNQCEPNVYKVFSFLELVSLFSKIENYNEQTVKDDLLDLAKAGLISLKYIDEQQACLSVLDKGRETLKTNAESYNATTKKFNSYFVWAFFGAFIGGALTALLAFALALVSGCA